MVQQPCQSIRVFHSSTKDPYGCAYALSNTRPELNLSLQTRADSARSSLVHSQQAGPPTSPSAGISPKAIQWGLQQRLVVTPSAEHGRAQIWLTNAGFGSTSAVKNKQKPVLQPTHSQPHEELYHDTRGRVPKRHKSIPSSSACEHMAYLPFVGNK